MAGVSGLGARSAPPGSVGGDVVVLYQNERTRVTRMAAQRGVGTGEADGSAARAATVICKQMLGPSAIARVRHELLILARLGEVGGVVRPVSADLVPGGAVDGHTIVFADVGGRSLAEVLRSGRPDLGGLSRLALALARIVGEVHRAGVVHRDLNPANIVVRASTAEPLLIDFDLATTVAEARPGFTHHREIVGTLPYLAPEQTGRTGRPVDSRADLYALGATLYEVATGHPPFGNGDPLQLVRDILVRVPRRLVEVVPGVSPGLSDVVARLLEKEPQRRYQSAEGLVHDLALLCENPGLSLRLGERDFPGRLSPPSTLVGRDAEIGSLSVALDEAVRGRARGILVAGAPGVGKSALIEQLRPLVTARGGWYVVGKFDQYRHDAASGAVVQALGGLGRLLLAEPEGELAGQRARILAALGPNAGLATAAVPEFEALLGADHPADKGDPTETEARLRQTALDLLRAVASPQRPIVVVLDDLQWALLSTLGVIDAVLTDENLRGLLLVGAYRDQEVDAAHPLTAMLSRWERLGVAPALLRLENLPAADLGTLVAEMLRLAAEPAAALAAAVGERTGGNPYDTVELVNALRRDGALALGDTGWRWDASTIRRYIGRGDVVDLLKDRIDRLPTRTRQLLEIMACLGGEMSMDLLATASGQTEAEVSDLLAAALEDALLVMDQPDQTDRAVCLRFRHDRVQQAVHDRLAPDARNAQHLAIARRLTSTPRFQAQTAQQYMVAVETLYASVHGDHDPAELELVAELFSTAAKGSTQVNNHVAAERYLAAATGLWTALGVSDDDPALARLETDRHAALYSLGRLDVADGVYRSIERRCPNPLSLVDAACLQISSLANRSRPADAVALGFAMLERLGFAGPGPDLRAEVEQRFEALYEWIDRVTVEEDLARPAATDPHAIAAARLIRRIVPPALFSDQTVLAWVIAEGQRLWAEYGPSAQLVPTFGAVCFSTIWVRQDYRTGARIARHVLAVGEALGQDVLIAQARYLYATSGCHWFEPLEENVRQARMAREVLLRSGDLHSTAFTFCTAVYALVDCGQTLDDLSGESEAALAFYARTGNDYAAAIQRVYRQFAHAMRGQTDEPGSFNDASFDEDAHAKVHRRIAVQLYIYRALSAVIFDDAASLRRFAALAFESAPLVLSLYASVVAQLVRALALARQIASAPPQELPELLAELDACRDWLAARAADAPENFDHLVHLVDAERAWVRNDFRSVIVAFDAALCEVENRQRPWHRALIAERAGQFHLANGIDRTGRWLLTQARHWYAQWGATGKVRELDRVHPFLRRAGATAAVIDHPAPRNDHGASLSVRTDDIDMLGILRASQALSSETSLDRLYAGVAEQMRALTGATNVLLLLHDDDRDGWVLPATTESASNGGGRDTPLTVAEAGAQGLLPLTAFRYTERTRQPLVVENAARDDRFARDPYLNGVDRCSLLVVPIAKQGTMRAVLLLENRLSSGAFSADRLDTVMLIAGQLAVSLDNALLYRRLEDKVAERTQELRAANEQLETLSLTDPLTGLANRRRFTEVLETSWRNARAVDGRIAIAMIDVDHFKWYNDDYGHPAGDACLQKVANALTLSIRQDTDLVCRYGGEEFAIILPGSGQSSAVVVAERARQAVNALAQPHGRNGPGFVTLSIGVAATVPVVGYPADSLVKAADVALYEAKQLGRNQVRAADDPLTV